METKKIRQRHTKGHTSPNYEKVYKKYLYEWRSRKCAIDFLGLNPQTTADPTTAVDEVDDNLEGERVNSPTTSDPTTVTGPSTAADEVDDNFEGEGVNSPTTTDPTTVAGPSTTADEVDDNLEGERVNSATTADRTTSPSLSATDGVDSTAAFGQNPSPTLIEAVHLYPLLRL